MCVFFLAAELKEGFEFASPAGFSVRSLAASSRRCLGRDDASHQLDTALLIREWVVSDSLGKPVCTPTSFSKFLVCLVLGTVACMGARTTNTACSAALLAPKLALFRALCRFQKNNGPKTAHLANRSV